MLKECSVDEHCSGVLKPSLPNPMISHPHPEFPPSDFVAFLAQRSGLSEEAAEHRLEDWLDEYYASTSHRANTRSPDALAI